MFNRDYSSLDRPDVLPFIFHPRPENPGRQSVLNAVDEQIPVDGGDHIGCRFHIGSAHHPTILMFHGNGEIVSDYDELGPLYNQMGINFIAADYRGYGLSTGTPTVSAMMKDCHKIFNFVLDWLRQNSYSKCLVLMGRSLGSASALELAAAHAGRYQGVILESSFAYAGPLLRLLGVDPDRIGFSEKTGFENIAKIRSVQAPVLVIHAENDHIIPFSDGQALFDNCSSAHKRLVKIAGANHNDIFLKGLQAYLAGIKNLIEIAAHPVDSQGNSKA